MKRVATVASLLLLGTLLAACKTLGPSWRLTATNWKQPFHDSEIEVLVCTGELRSTLVAGTSVNLTVSAEPDDSAVDEVRHEGELRVGDPVRIEATCTDADGREIGYTRIEGRLGPPEHTTHSASTHVYPPAAPGAERINYCLSPAETRGQPPCLVARLVIPGTTNMGGGGKMDATRPYSMMEIR